jgi:protoheme IX farnesyltransferase
MSLTTLQPVKPSASDVVLRVPAAVLALPPVLDAADSVRLAESSRGCGWGSVWARLRDYVALTKPRIAAMVLVTVATGAYVGAAGSPAVAALCHAVLGTAIVAAGASALNQVLERGSDARMRRTRNRPLPAGRLDCREAAIFGTVLIAVGVAYLALAVNGRVAGLAGLTAVLYVAAYTPSKRWTTLNTLIGAVPGALPPVIGWAATTEQLGAEAGVLFLIVFLWQFPHFLAIAWLYRDEYRHAGLQMLSGVDRDGSMTGRQMVAYSLALVPVALSPRILELAGMFYFWGALLLSVGFLGCSIRFALAATDERARVVLRASLLYLPILLVLLMADLQMS